MNSSLQLIEIGRGNQIDFVEQYHISKGNLLFDFVAIFDMQHHVLGVDQRYDAIQAHCFAQFIIHKKRLSHRPWIGHAGCFNHNVIKLVATLH